MNKKKIAILMVTVVIICGALFFFFNEDKAEYMPYKEFYGYVENGKVTSAQVGEKEVEFYLDGEETKYRTDNPELDTFKEFLLLNEVEVKAGEGIDEILVNITDLIFNVLFFGVIIFALYKLKGFISTFKVIRHTKTRFSDVAGMEELKKEMMQAVDILKHPKEYAAKGIRQVSGIMLEGNPGNGKTLFARALAGEANVNFIATKATDFQSAIMSIGPSKIKALFRKARANKPCIIFIDEFDGIGEKRNYSGTGIDKENNRLITAMLNELDGFSRESGVMVIAATNNYKALDEALVRAGRFDKKYTVPYPDFNTRLELIRIYTKNKKIDSRLPIEKLSEAFEGLSCSQIETILNEAAMIASANGSAEIKEADIAAAIRRTCNVSPSKRATRMV